MVVVLVCLPARAVVTGLDGHHREQQTAELGGEIRLIRGRCAERIERRTDERSSASLEAGDGGAVVAEQATETAQSDRDALPDAVFALVAQYATRKIPKSRVEPAAAVTV